jgi:DmsE family decaheme c-type cytochrome
MNSEANKTANHGAGKKFRFGLKNFGFWTSTALLLAGVISCTTYNYVRERPATTPGAHYVGVASCAQCHDGLIDDIMQPFAFTAHGSLLAKNEHACESCHGPGSIHVEEGEGSIVLPNDASCLECHIGHDKHKHTARKSLMDWNFAEHKRAGVKCIDCHDPHSPGAKGIRSRPEFQFQHTDATSSLCLSCHQEIAGRISMPYHHMIREGAMSCTSCHNPHSNMSRSLLVRNETCVKCHQAQQGPFAREHQPVVEGCTTCHDPHGSPVPKMVKIAQPMLCLQCHPLTMNRHQSFGTTVSPAALRDCTSCHGAIHGSDIEPYLRH